MGRNIGGRSWLNAVKRVFGSPTNKRDNEREEQDEKRRAKRRWIFRKPTIYITTIQHNEANNVTATTRAQTLAKNPTSDVVESNQSHAIALAMATTAAAEAAVTPRSSTIARKYYISAIIIQTMFRGYLARRALKALKGIVKIQALVRGYNVRKRAKMTLQCIQSLIRVQARVRDQRRRLSCGSNSLRESHPPNHNSIYSSHTSTVEDEWNAYQYTLEEIKAMLQKPKEAAPFPSSAKARQVHSASPTSAASVPHFMAATASAKARFRSQSAPRQRRTSPDRNKIGRAKKRLYFPAPEALIQQATQH